MRTVILLAAGVSVALSSAANAADEQAAMIATMRKVGTAWERISGNQERFITRCAKGGFAAFRLKSGSSATYDVIRTDSLMHPYAGIVRLHGIFEENTISYDRSCSPTVAAALANNNWWGIQELTDWVISYQLEGEELKFNEASQTFLNNGGYELTNISSEGSHPFENSGGTGESGDFCSPQNPSIVSST